MITDDMQRWLIWFVIAALLFFGGWGIKDSISVAGGRALMALGFLLGGFLITFAAWRNINKK